MDARQRIRRAAVSRLTPSLTRPRVVQGLDHLIPDRVVEGARHQMLHRVDRLERRLRAASRARATEAVMDLATVRAALMPENQRQERRLNPVPMLARHGDLLLAQLKAGAAMHAGSLVGG